MATVELVLLLLAAVLVSAVLDKIVPKVTSPLIQIGLGLLIALFADDFISVELDPELFLVVFIAPLLYNDAREADKGALWANRGPVISLAVGLVMITALLVGGFVHWFIPAIPLTAAIALGAALGPTDAVAVSSLPKDLNIGQRERSILKGECLINDASGIVTFQFAAAACATGAFSLWTATGAFAISFFGGLLIGALLGVASNLLITWVRSIGLDSTTFHVLFDLFMPFIVFLAAEPFGASGVIAVVTAGLVSTMGKRRVGPSVSRLNIVSTSVWRVVSYALNGIVFVLLGTQLPKAMQSTWDNVTLDDGMLILYIVAVAFAVMLVRFLWLAGMEYASLPRAERRSRFGKESLRSALLMTLAGAKGTVTLSIAFTLPITTSLGTYFPQRQLIIFLACGVILITLLLANFVIPLIAPKHEHAEDEQARKHAETEAVVDILRTVVEELAAQQTPENRDATQSVIRSYNDRIERTKTEELEDEVMIELRTRLIHWEQEYLQEALDHHDADPVVVYKLMLRLSQREHYLRHSRLSATMRARIRRMLSYARSLLHRLMNGLPGVNVTEEAIEERTLSIKAMSYGCKRLHALLQSDEDIPTEAISALLVESGRTLSAMKLHRPSITAIAAVDDKATEVQRRGLALEMEFIMNMYEEGRISRSCAKRLRENVALMQIDLEEKV